MKLLNEIKELFNHGFERGFTIFQLFLVSIMFLSLVKGNNFLLLFSTFMCLGGYFEP